MALRCYNIGMSQNSLKNNMPPIIRKLLPSSFNENKPSESFADCLNCPMCAKNEDKHSDQRYFSPNTKCCTFSPILPNYVVGVLLNDPHIPKKTKETIAHLIATKEGAFPHGIFPTEAYLLNYDTVKLEKFGQDENWLSFQSESVNKSKAMALIRSKLQKTYKEIKEEILYSSDYYGNDKVFIGMVADSLLKEPSDSTEVKQ